jgi:hypothetical protein
MKAKISKWLPAVYHNKSQFNGVITHIDKMGIISMYDKSSEKDLIMMNNIINFYFNGKTTVYRSFKVGDPVAVKYRVNGCEYRALAYPMESQTFFNLLLGYYRGIIVGAENDEFTVEFIDYGTIQTHIKASELSAQVLCQEIPPYAHKYRFEGTPEKGEDGEINQNSLGIFFANVVNKTFWVEVHPDDINNNEPGYVKRCFFESHRKVLRNYADLQSFNNNFE